MDNKKIKKGANLLGIIMTMFLCIAFVVGGYSYFSEQMSQSNRVVDSKYTYFYNNINSSQSSLSTQTETVKNQIDQMKESDNPLIAAWNGLKGLGSTLLIFKSLPGMGVEMVTATFNMMDQIDTWLQGIIIAAILVFVIVIVLKVIKGEPGGID